MSQTFQSQLIDPALLGSSLRSREPMFLDYSHKAQANEAAESDENSDDSSSESRVTTGGSGAAVEIETECEDAEGGAQ